LADSDSWHSPEPFIRLWRIQIHGTPVVSVRACRLGFEATNAPKGQFGCSIVLRIEPKEVKMSTKNEILKMIQRHADDLKGYGVIKVGIFGSFARATYNSKSDIDVLVEFGREKKTFDNYMGLKFYLEKLFRRKVDLVIKDALKARIKDRVLSEVKYA
jgi:predicted nucleotidyltransferase